MIVSDPNIDANDLGVPIYARYLAANEARQSWLSLWQECYDLTLPEHGRFYGDLSAPTRKRDALFDGTAPDAVDQLAASLLAELTPAWVNWFTLDVGGGADDLAADLAPVLAKSTKTIQDQIDRSNLGVELHQCFLDLVVGGTCVLRLDELPPGSPVAFTSACVPLSEVTLAPDALGALNHVYRRRLVRGADLMRADLNRLDQALEIISEKPDNLFEIIEFSEPFKTGFQTGVLVVDVHDTPTLVDLRRVSRSPYIACRWVKTPAESYGRSPVMKALPDIKTANKVVELVLKNASIAVTGIWQAEDDGVLNPANIQLVPGAIIPKAVGSAGLKPLEMPARFDVSQLVLSDLRARIRHALLVDRFAALDDPRMTATEVMERSAEMTRLLSATYGRLQAELLSPLLHHLYAILRGRGVIADIALDGHHVMLTHNSPLARAGAQQGVRPILSWLAALRDLGGGMHWPSLIT